MLGKLPRILSAIVVVDSDRFLNALAVLLSLLFSLSGCEEDDYELGPINSPSNLQVNVDIVGVDDLNPYGDGSGVVNFAATAFMVIM